MTRRGDDTTRERPWMCVRCGYLMSAATPFDRGHHEPPDEGDLSICLNCALPYVREDGRWRAMTGKDWDGLVPEERRELLMAIHEQRTVIQGDLRKRERGGRA
jgi:hypothetical protein